MTAINPTCPTCGFTEVGEETPEYPPTRWTGWLWQQGGLDENWGPLCCPNCSTWVDDDGRKVDVFQGVLF
jgi:hypothetical protein